MKNMGFRWKISLDKIKILMESQDVRLKRVKYLNQLSKYKQEDRPMIFTDETYINSSHTRTHAWEDDTMLGLKEPISKGRRLIIVVCGESGFIPNALLFRSGSKSGDCHDDMNYNNFSKWVENQLLPNLPPKAVLVVDNASYHNVTYEERPTSNALKKDTISWLVI